MIDVEQRRLRAFEHDAAVFRAQLRQEQRDVADPRAKPLAEHHHLVEQRLPVERRFLDDLVARVHVLADFLRQRVPVAEQVAHADAAAADLVLVGRADAAGGRADLPLAAARFRQHVELAVVRQDDVSLLADEEPSADLHPHPRQLVHFLEERLRIDHHAVADDAGDARVQDARRDEMEDELGALHVHRVPRVVAALVARHRREVRGQHVDDLALALVAPLRAQHRDVHGHAGYIVIRGFGETFRTTPTSRQ